jgi:hypothetical protein
VVNGGSAGDSVGEDTAGVGLEVGSLGVNGDGDGLVGEGGLEGTNALGGHLGEAGNTNVTGLTLVVAAGTVASGVGVSSLEVGVVFLEVAERAGLPTTVATLAGLDAVDELLLREGEELTGSDLVSTFEGTS